MKKDDTYKLFKMVSTYDAQGLYVQYEYRIKSECLSRLYKIDTMSQVIDDTTYWWL